MHHPTDRLAHTTAFVTPVLEHWLEREIVQWVHSLKDRFDDPSHHERTLLPRSYISLLAVNIPDSCEASSERLSRRSSANRSSSVSDVWTDSLCPDESSPLLELGMPSVLDSDADDFTGVEVAEGNAVCRQNKLL